MLFRSLPEGALTADGFTTWERFLVAHELGHFFLSQFKVPKPLGSREYWNTERVCDKFARQLLLPSREVSQVVTVAGDSTKDLLSATLHLHTKWAVPWPVAAFEVADYAKTVHFFRLQSKEDRFRVSASTLPNKLRTGCIIAATSSLGSLLRDLPQNDGKPKQVPVARFGDFEILSRVTDVAVYRAGLSEYRIATRPA